MSIQKIVSDNNLTLHGVFEAQVEKTPEAIALVFEQEQLTYRELNERANQLAHFLRSLNVAPEMLVGICLERSIETIAGMLGILKAGAAFIPIDPSQPQERLAFVLADTKVDILLTFQKWVARIPASLSHLVCLDAEEDNISAKSKSNPVSGVRSENLAYTIYTSGSTGQPKGVMVNHQAICQGFSWMQENFPIAQQDRILQKLPLTFDFSFWELFWPLMTGACVVLAQPGGEKDNAYLVKLIARQEISILVFVPSILQVFLGEEELKTCKNIRMVFTGGEPLTSALKARFFQKFPDCQLYDLFGATEDIVVTYWPCQSEEKSSRFPHGRPFPNLSIYVVDEQLQRVPIGEKGELLVGGWGLARGYLNRPELTAQKFIANPFNSDSEQRLYRTGDLVRYLPEGIIEILGRIDRQVKIRGFRIELGEIEEKLSQHLVVKQVAVIAREDVPGDKRLVAYVVLYSSAESEQKTIASLRHFLKQQLPDYMMPAVFVVLNQMPKTPNGKVDRLALPAPDKSRPELEEALVMPQSETEKRIARIWQDVLQLEEVGIHDNFFELGGNSLLTVRVMADVRDTLDVELPVRCLFEHPTVEKLAQILLKESRNDVSPFNTAIDLRTEAVLPPDIYPERSISIEQVCEPRHIFITGATGFLGVYLVYELLQQTQANLYCLVRASNLKEGKKRLAKSLKKYLLWEPETNLSSRIIPVIGDLSQPLLGLSLDRFEKLSHQIDTIYHSAASTNFIMSYLALKSQNVIGTQEVIRFACQGKGKVLHHISTVAVYGAKYKFTGQSVYYEDEDIFPSKDYLYFGYAESKWVAELLVWEARSRGLPVTIIRPGYLIGNTQTGIMNTTDDLSRMIMGCIKMGSFPSFLEQTDEIIPVDYAAKVIVNITKNKESLNKPFHVAPPLGHNITMEELFDLICSYGYKLKKLPYLQWVNELTCHCKFSQNNPLFPLLPFYTEKVYQDMSVPEIYTHTPEYDNKNVLNVLTNSPLRIFPSIDAELIATCLSFFIRSGLIETPN